MVLVAPDKYRGTLSSAQAVRVICSAITAKQTFPLPMADGGEGTAAIIASRSAGWEMLSEGCYVNTLLKKAAIDSSAFIGYTGQILSVPPSQRTSSPLGEILNDVYSEFRPSTIYLGIGGTAVCDAGKGMLKVLKTTINWKNILIGLADVAVPLTPPDFTAFPDSLSALSFCPQKGYSSAEIKAIEREFRKLRSCSPFSGAGGGLGFALADVLGAKCFSGAK